MQLALNIIEIVAAVLLVALILLQNKGTGLSAAFGGTAGMQTVRRGPEQTLHVMTVIVAFVLFGAAFIDLFFS